MAAEVLDFEEYVRTRQDALLRSARRLVNDPMDAQDLLQTALVRTYGHWDGIADKSFADAYLRRVMINTRTEWWRSRRLQEVPTEHLPDVMSVEDGTEQRADRALLLDLLGTLAPKQRRVVVLAAVGTDEHRRDGPGPGDVVRHGQEHPAPFPGPAARGTGAEEVAGVRRLTAVRAVAVAVAVAAALTSCAGTGDGVRLEGSPTASRTPHADASVVTGSADESRGGDSTPSGGEKPRVQDPTDPSPGATRVFAGGDSTTNVIALLRRDPKVSDNVKRGLKPCRGHTWPVTVTFGHATGGDRVDQVVNVSSCGADAVGVGTYVYRRSTSGTLVDVFAAEGPPVQGEFDKGRLVVTRYVYLGDGPKCCPSGRDEVTYDWRDGVFRKVGHERTDVASQDPKRGDDGKD